MFLLVRNIVISLPDITLHRDCREWKIWIDIIDKFEETLIAKDMNGNEDCIEDIHVKEDSDKETNSIKYIDKVVNDKEDIVQHTNDTDDIPEKDVKLGELKCLATQEKFMTCQLLKEVLTRIVTSKIT